ncbi:GbsR/MarR family transcriptional regulator [Promicromonospora kroppenstedtii]|uniref:GbsR/MarR family transcriptional regulator n=1 Tax=Promicromonospora kroppenstedtii TaxID=440482 RepID=A0ABW7XFG2_9MICO
MDPQDPVLEWVERVSMYLARDGVPPIAGRVLGWLMVCDPPEQSAGQISDSIGASRASLTSNLRLLTTMGFLSSRTRPGNRTTYYRMADDAWSIVVRRQIAGMASFLDLSRDGIALAGPGNDDRVRQAHRTFEWMAAAFAAAPPLTTGPDEPTHDDDHEEKRR